MYPESRVAGCIVYCAETYTLKKTLKIEYTLFQPARTKAYSITRRHGKLMKRRQFIQLIAVSSIGASAVADAETQPLTVSQQEGPYYPVEPIPESNNLLLSDRHLGSELHLSGRVLDVAGKPLASARVEIWQCDGRGIYPHPRAPSHKTFDPEFSGAGTSHTTADGHYEFVTIVPVPYTGRPPHIRTKVFDAGSEKLTSQIYLRESGGDKRLKIDLEENASTAFTATFDFVIKT